MTLKHRENRKSAGRISVKRQKPSAFASSLSVSVLFVEDRFTLVLLLAWEENVFTCVSLCLLQGSRRARTAGLASRSLSAITHVHLHTTWTTIGMKRGLWLRLILEGRTLNTTVNNRAAWMARPTLNSSGGTWSGSTELLYLSPEVLWTCVFLQNVNEPFRNLDWKHNLSVSSCSSLDNVKGYLLL